MTTILEFYIRFPFDLRVGPVIGISFYMCLSNFVVIDDDEIMTSYGFPIKIASLESTSLFRFSDGTCLNLFDKIW